MDSKVCYICDVKLRSHCPPIQVCSSIISHSGKSFPDKIAEIIGEEFVIIVTPNDYICQRCSSIIKFIDTMERELQIVKDALLYLIQKKNQLLPADYTFNAIGVIDDNTQQQEAQKPNNLPVNKNSLQLFKSETFRSKKLYKCYYCPFKSHVLYIVHSHVLDHIAKRERRINCRMKAANALNPNMMKSSFRCQICFLIFDTREKCLHHAEEVHDYKGNKDKAEDVPSTNTKDLWEKKIEVQNDEEEKSPSTTTKDLQEKKIEVQNDEQEKSPSTTTKDLQDKKIEVQNDEQEESLLTTTKDLQEKKIEVQNDEQKKSPSTTTNNLQDKEIEVQNDEQEKFPSTTTKDLQEKIIEGQHDKQEESPIDLQSSYSNDIISIEFSLDSSSPIENIDADVQPIDYALPEDEQNITQMEIDALLEKFCNETHAFLLK